jgi:hypothetical protein
MSKSIYSMRAQKLQFIARRTIVDGASVNLKYVDIGGQTFTLSRRGPITIIAIEDQWYEDLTDPEEVIDRLRGNPGLKPDIFTFWQRLPNIEPKYPFRIELESIAALPIESYEYWLNKQIKSVARNKLRKSQKAKVELREVAFDDDFVRGVVNIFNETPTRQGRRFWHYGKDFETVKRQFSRFLFREDLIGAYYQNELIGFVMLGNASNYGVLGQIISMVNHRDKGTNNALIGKSVEMCARKKLPYLVYAFWSDSTLTDFKRSCGFEEVKLPRYFVPITQKGKLALKLGIHRGWKAAIPDQIKNPLKQVRRSWYAWQAKFASSSSSN